MPFLYDIALTVGLLVTSPYLLPKVILGRHGLKERLGLWPVDMLAEPHQTPRIWIHAASVGEVHSLVAFLPALRRVFPDHQFVLSVTTRAGRERASELGDEIRQIFYLPIDLTIPLKRILHRVHPEILLLTETELWPNLILQAHRCGVKVALINGRISSKSFSRYRLFKKSMSRVLSAIDLFCVQTEEDASRFQTLGAKKESLVISGNFKGDLLMMPQMRGQRSAVRASLGISPETRLLVAGSTRPGEEQMLLDALVHLRETVPPFRAIVAPRHVQRAHKVARLLQTRGFIVQRHSHMEAVGERAWEILVVDSLGQLMRLYSAADVAFVGGSLMPYGGHNPLEPASYGIPVVFGCHMENCRCSAQLLLDSQGGLQVKNGSQLKETIARLFSADEERIRRGANALRAVQKSSGAAERTAKILHQAVH